MSDLIRAILKPLLMPLFRWWYDRKWDAYWTPERINAMAWQLFADHMFHLRYQA